MAYNRLNHLLRMRDIVELYCREKKPGVSTAHIFRTFIYPRYHISISTLYVYLATPISRMLKEELDRRGKHQESACRQLEIFQ